MSVEIHTNGIVLSADFTRFEQALARLGSIAQRSPEKVKDFLGRQNASGALAVYHSSFVNGAAGSKIVLTPSPALSEFLNECDVIEHLGTQSTKF